MEILELKKYGIWKKVTVYSLDGRIKMTRIGELEDWFVEII
jgi:hypothetical protein